MAQFNFKAFEKDTYKMSKFDLTQLYLWLHTPKCMTINNQNGISKEDVLKIRKIVKEIIEKKFDVEISDVEFGLGYEDVLS